MGMTNEPYNGPLFVVGMPRSGTKLLRAMLNQHPRIRFSSIETEFFPFWVRNWRQFGPMNDPETFRRFYRGCARLPFFLQIAERGNGIEWEHWFRSCMTFTPAGVFEALMRCVLCIPPEDNSTIWCDKSPTYISHVPLLIQQYPKAKVIHIVRDVRDFSLSMRNAWGKSMLRAAQRWQDDVSKCRKESRQVSSSYMEIRYEDLLAGPMATMEQICKFIGVNFDERMLTPGAETENRGDAKGVSTVLTNNVRKYQSKMSSTTVSQIEEIACPTLRALHYPCTYSGQAVRLPAWKLRMFQVTDGLSLLRATLSRRGLVGALRFHFEHFRTSGNRVR